jgi:hypothetical protein
MDNRRDIKGEFGNCVMRQPAAANLAAREAAFINHADIYSAFCKVIPCDAPSRSSANYEYFIIFHPVYFYPVKFTPIIFLN